MACCSFGHCLCEEHFTLFLFYEVLTFSTYPLVTHYGDAEAKRAGRIYGHLAYDFCGVFVIGCLGDVLFCADRRLQVGGYPQWARSAVASDGLASLYLSARVRRSDAFS